MRLAQRDVEESGSFVQKTDVCVADVKLYIQDSLLLENIRSLNAKKFKCKAYFFKYTFFHHLHITCKL